LVARRITIQKTKKKEKQEVKEAHKEAVKETKEERKDEEPTMDTRKMLGAQFGSDSHRDSA